MNKAKIVGVEVYAGNQVVGNDRYIKHFENQGQDVRALIEGVLGRKERRLRTDQNENSVSMSVVAVNRLLEKHNRKGTDIDLIVFSSQTAEYSLPATALIIHKQIEGRSDATCYDINVNCTGMVVALDMVCRQIQTDKRCNTVLLIGCDLLSNHEDPNNPITYGSFGDAACAMLIESTEEESGVIDYLTAVNSEFYDRIVFPKEGLNHYLKQGGTSTMDWLPFDGTSSVEPSYQNLKKLLEGEGVEIGEVAAFCCSQFSIQNIEIMAEYLGIAAEKIIYIADEYGYTGTTSPMIALHRALTEKTIKRGDYIVFWGVGAGWKTSVMLFKY